MSSDEEGHRRHGGHGRRGHSPGRRGDSPGRHGHSPGRHGHSPGRRHGHGHGPPPPRHHDEDEEHDRGHGRGGGHGGHGRGGGHGGHGHGGSHGGSHGSCDGDGPVDVSSWIFFQRIEKGGHVVPTAYLVGPVVGTVTDTTARILVEVATNDDVTMEAFMDGRRVYEHTQRVEKRTPTAFQLDGFEANKRILVKVNVGDHQEEREARFTTTSDKEDWKISTVSCNCHSRMERIALWERLARVVGDVDCVLHLGDQIYADMDRVSRKNDSKRFHSAWEASNRLLESLDDEEGWETVRNKILEEYRRIYRLTWNYPELAKVLASTANYMICDDHEVVDDLGDQPEHVDPSCKQFFIIKLAYQVYLEYQKQLLCDTDVLDMEQKAYYRHRLSPRVAFFMCDNRVERSIHRAKGDEGDWEDKQFLGPDQWKIMKTIRRAFNDTEVLLFGSPTPIVFLSQGATKFASMIMDDAKGTWGYPIFKEEQAATCALLSRWQNDAPNRAVVTLGGDVHIGGFTDSWHEGHDAPLHQMTASAIGNIPEGNIDSTKAVIMRKAMDADSSLFPFKVEHHDWIYGANFGMIDLTVGKHNERPDVTLTLVPVEGEPIVRNLAFGNSNVQVEDPDQHEAAGKAHATASVMA